MANEPERPIERLLRAAANKRRQDAGAPLELHPAERRLLQGEVARQFAKAEAEARPRLPLLVRLWPRLAWAAAILAFLTVAVALLLPGPGKTKPDMLLAGNQRMLEEQLARETASSRNAGSVVVSPPPREPMGQVFVEPKRVGATHLETPASASAPRVQPQVLVKDGLEVKSLPQSAVPPASPAPASKYAEPSMQLAASAATPAQPQAKIGNDLFQNRYGLTSHPTAPADAPPASAPAYFAGTSAGGIGATEADQRASRSLRAPSPGGVYKSLATAASADKRAPSRAASDEVAVAYAKAAVAARAPRVVQRYLRATPEPVTEAAFVEKDKKAQPVLGSFQVELLGRQLTITDSDGSVYSGLVQVAKPSKGLRLAKTEAPAGASALRTVGGALEEKATTGFDWDQLAPQSYSFRVAGTNRTLRKNVVFSGNLIVGKNLMLSDQAVTNAIIVDRLGDVPIGAQTLAGPRLLHSQITGKVVVGGGKAVEINALPAKP